MPQNHWLALTSLTPIFLQAARKLSMFLRNLAADSLGWVRRRVRVVELVFYVVDTSVVI
jgi:hypothetical protein